MDSEMNPTPSRESNPSRNAEITAAVRTFADGLAHALSNVLGGIMGFAQLARQDIEDPVAADAHLADLLKAAQRAREVLQQVLVFSRVQEHTAKEVSLAAFIAEALPRWRATMPANIELASRCDPECAPVFADPVQLEQAIGCLLANAVRAIGENRGQIEISLASGAPGGTETSASPSSAEYVRLSVRDNGTGIQTDVVEQIFEPFFSTLPIGRGIGLGLAIVDAIVSAAGGVVRLETEPGRGTAFHLYFPALDCHAKTHASTSSSGAPSAETR
jgi:signal transduction histidine kinase